MNFLHAHWHWIALTVWVLCGVIHGMINRSVGGWLIMITDSRNTYHTWLAFPALFLAWLLWPIGGNVSEFFAKLSFGLPNWWWKNKRNTYQLPEPLPVVEDLHEAIANIRKIIPQSMANEMVGLSSFARVDTKDKDVKR